MKTVRLYTNPCESGYVIEFEGNYYPFSSDLSVEGEFDRVAHEIVFHNNIGYVHYLSREFYRSQHERCVALCINPLAVREFPSPAMAH